MALNRWTIASTPALPWLSVCSVPGRLFQRTYVRKSIPKDEKFPVYLKNFALQYLSQRTTSEGHLAFVLSRRLKVLSQRAMFKHPRRSPLAQTEDCAPVLDPRRTDEIIASILVLCLPV